MRSFHHQDGSFFIRTRLPADEQRLAVGLLIDESGSMGWGDRITHARKTAIVLYDFCVSLGIPVTIYGHSTDYRGVALYSYAEFDSVDENDRYRLMDMIDRSGNRDGAALRFVAEHLAKRPENRKLLILISDGQPADTGYRTVSQPIPVIAARRQRRTCGESRRNTPDRILFCLRQPLARTRMPSSASIRKGFWTLPVWMTCRKT